MIEKRITSLQKKIHETVPAQSGLFIVVDSASQQMQLVEENRVVRTFSISTSKWGMGNSEGSFQTPTGTHQVVEKIGRDAPAARIFKDRLDTGVNWHEGLTEDNMILSRILRLRGLEPGINSGTGIDSFNRYIYIHGTNREQLIGTPMSHGCICMKNQDIIELFDTIREGTIVYIA